MVVILLLAALGATVLGSATTFRKRQIARDLLAEVHAPDRYVDFGIVIKTVTADLAGAELLTGKPRVRVLREWHVGGMVDTRSNPPRIVGPSLDPVVWHCSEDQEAVLRHRDPAKPGQLVVGSEGSGKTTTLAMWHALRVLEHLGEDREGLQTAPTEKRLDIIRREMFQLYPPSWFTYRTVDKLFVFAEGTQLRLISTHTQNSADGSPIQGFNASWAGRDEGQDQVEAHDDIESRGRSAKNGVYPQLITATNKSRSTWRNLRDRLSASPLWMRRTLFGKRSPFVFPSFWDAKASSMDAHEFRRRIERPDLDQPPELAVYVFERQRNLVARPRISTDVTAAVLARYQSYTRPGARFTLLVGHDPGSIYNTSTVLRLIMFGSIPTWVVVGELQTKQTSAREHAEKLRIYLEKKFGVERRIRDHNGNERIDPESPKVAVFCDPHGTGQGETDYDTVYRAFQREGLDVFSPSQGGKKIKRSARVGMINRLLRDGREIARLVIACDEPGVAAAPILVESFEQLEKKPGDDNAEGTQRKDETDRTHAPASIGYALWVFEQEAFTDHTVKTALDEARRYA